MRRSPLRRPAHLAALAAAVLLAACATPPTVSPEQATSPADERMMAHPSEAPARLRPMPVRPLDVQADCRFKDEAGYAAAAMLDISHSDVKAFSARVDVPRRGSCRFDGAFTQTRRLPSVELKAKDGCTVNIWEQGDKVTVGFADCAGRCSRGTFDYVWPIIVDRSSGECH